MDGEKKIIQASFEAIKITAVADVSSPTVLVFGRIGSKGGLSLNDDPTFSRYFLQQLLLEALQYHSLAPVSSYTRPCVLLDICFYRPVIRILGILLGNTDLVWFLAALKT